MTLRQAYAASSAADVEAAKARGARARRADVVMAPATPAGRRRSQPAKPKAASKPAPQKILRAAQRRPDRRHQGPAQAFFSQEPYWPAVETALRAVARKIHATREAEPNASGMPVDPDLEEVQQLKSAAMPLLFQLREDQKDEVRRLARIIGLEKVAAAI